VTDIASLKRSFEQFSEKQRKKMLTEAFQKKHKLRLRFYQALLDYIESTDSQNINTFFKWYLDNINKRAGKTAHLVRQIQKITKTQSDGKFRSFLVYCITDINKGRDFTSVVQQWVPKDELQLLSANRKSDFSDIIRALINIVEDKIESGKLVENAIVAILPTTIIIGIVHAVLSTVLYPSFITSSVIEGIPPSDRDMTLLEERYMTYLAIMDSPYLIVGTILIFSAIVYWSMDNWSKRGLFLREQYFDFLPPYSLSKINNQYQISLLSYHYMSAGVSWSESLKSIHKISSPYIKQVIEQIQRRTVKLTPEQAINVFYMGETGNMIEDRGSRKELTIALEGMLESLRERKNASFNNTVNVTAKFIYKPVLWITALFFLFPVLMHIFEMMQAANNT